jgi:hypothetical protein
MSEQEKNNANNDPIGNALNLPANKPETNGTVSTIIADAHNDSARTDFEIARANIHTIIENGSDALSKLSQIANSSQHPKAYEALAKLTEIMLKANKDLLDLQTKIRTIDAAFAPINDEAKTINNNLFVGSTAELQKVLKNLRNDNSTE